MAELALVRPRRSRCCARTASGDPPSRGRGLRLRSGCIAGIFHHEHAADAQQMQRRQQQEDRSREHRHAFGDDAARQPPRAAAPMYVARAPWTRSVRGRDQNPDKQQRVTPARRRSPLRSSAHRRTPIRRCAPQRWSGRTTTTAAGYRSEKRATRASMAVTTAVATVIIGRAAAGHALRKVASRNAFAAIWCASMVPQTAIAIRVRLRFTPVGIQRAFHLNC